MQGFDCFFGHWGVGAAGGNDGHMTHHPRCGGGQWLRGVFGNRPGNQTSCQLVVADAGDLLLHRGGDFVGDPCRKGVLVCGTLAADDFCDQISRFSRPVDHFGKPTASLAIQVQCERNVRRFWLGKLPRKLLHRKIHAGASGRNVGEQGRNLVCRKGGSVGQCDDVLVGGSQLAVSMLQYGGNNRSRIQSFGPLARS